MLACLFVCVFYVKMIHSRVSCFLPTGRLILHWIICQCRRPRPSKPTGFWLFHVQREKNIKKCLFERATILDDSYLFHFLFLSFFFFSKRKGDLVMIPITFSSFPGSFLSCIFFSSFLLFPPGWLIDVWSCNSWVCLLYRRHPNHPKASPSMCADWTIRLLLFWPSSLAALCLVERGLFSFFR
jgi:hypothetical protein